MNVLVVEDEPKLADGLARFLTYAGFHVSVAGTLAEAKRQLEQPFDAVLLDVRLPDGEGWTLIPKLKTLKPRPAIILATARGEADDRVFGLELGADDYLVKPIVLKELEIRLKRLVKQTDEISFGDMTVDARSRTVTDAGQAIRMTNKEYELLLFFYELSPVVAIAFIGAFWQVLVMFGLHWGLVPIIINNLAVVGMDTIVVGVLMATFGQVGATLAITLKARDPKTKGLGTSSTIAGVFGITEPAIYGLTLPRKKPFVFGMVGGAAGGVVGGMLGTAAYAMGGLGVFSIPVMIPATGLDMTFYGALIGMAVATLVSFGLTFAFHKEVASEETSPRVEPAPVLTDHVGTPVSSPVKGEVVALETVRDEVFSSGAMGKGIAIMPTEGVVYAPFDGEVVTVYQSKHAIGLRSHSGVEVLIHVGLDTVQLGGQHFESFVTDGQQVTEGDVLVKFDLEAIAQAGYDTITPVIVTNTGNYLDVLPTHSGIVEPNHGVLRVLA